MDYIRPGGTVVAVGLPAGAKVSAEVFWHVVYERKLVGSYVGNRQDAHEGQFVAQYSRRRYKLTKAVGFSSPRLGQHEEWQSEVPLRHSAVGRSPSHLRRNGCRPAGRQDRSQALLESFSGNAKDTPSVTPACYIATLNPPL